MKIYVTHTNTTVRLLQHVSCHCIEFSNASDPRRCFLKSIAPPDLSENVRGKGELRFAWQEYASTESHK